MINIKGFIIYSKGDHSVGIFSSQWELTGDFYFDDNNELLNFKNKILEAYEYVCDDAIIYTFEEFGLMNNNI